MYGMIIDAPVQFRYVVPFWNEDHWKAGDYGDQKSMPNIALFKTGWQNVWIISRARLYKTQHQTFDKLLMGSAVQSVRLERTAEIYNIFRLSRAARGQLHPAPALEPFV